MVTSYRKSINLGGGFKINLSKAGIGYSWGGRGFRISRSPDGTIRKTFSIPKTGIRYSTSSKAKKSNEDKETNLENDIAEAQNSAQSAEPDENVSDLPSATASDTVKAINLALKYKYWAKLSFWGCILIFLNPIFILFALVGYFLNLKSKKLLPVLEYSFDTEQEELYKNRLASFEILAESKYIWKNTGELIFIRRQMPTFLDTNVEVVDLQCQKKHLFFMPDLVFWFDGKKVKAFSYNELKITTAEVEHKEKKVVFEDAKVVGTTWHYTKKDGTKDMRYKNNAKYTVCAYGEVQISAPAFIFNFLVSNSQKSADFGTLWA